MEEIGMFEAKTRLSEICERVAGNGESVLLTRRGHPLVLIQALPAPAGADTSIWDELESAAPELTDAPEFELAEPATRAPEDLLIGEND